MIYAISDLHGCYEKYEQMLEKIKFAKEDTLYVLGDVIDRGPDGIKILQDMMRRLNVIPILGNHELMAYAVLSRLNVEITEDNYASQVDMQTLKVLNNWMFNGGQPTMDAFRRLSRSAREDILDYLQEFSLYEIVETGGRRFVLVHGDIGRFQKDKPLEDYEVDDFVWSRCNYNRVYFNDAYLVSGHTPTSLIDPLYRGKIYMANRNIAIDCGVVFDDGLGCICLDTLEQFYV